MYTKMKRSVGFVLIVMLLPLSAVLSQSAITPEMVVDLKSVVSVAIDPSAKWIAYVQGTPRAADEEKGSRYSELFVIPAGGGTARQFVLKPQSVKSPQWSPDSKWIYYLAVRKEHHEKEAVYRISLEGGDSQLVAKGVNAFKDFRLSPDGKWVAYAMEDPETADDKKNARIGDDVRTVYEFFKYVRLYVKPLEGGEAQDVSGTVAVWNFEWSPDASRLVYQASKTPKTDDSYMFKKLYTVARTGGDAKLLTETKGKLGEMRWSPDGQSIAFMAGVDESDPTQGSIFVVPAAGGDAANLTQNYEGTVQWLHWLDAKTLIFSATKRSHIVLNTMPAAGGAMKPIIESGYAFSQFSLADDGKTFAMVAGTDQFPPEAFTGSVSAKKLTRLTNSNPELANVKLSGSDEIAWQARDGMEITGVLMLPLNYEEGKKYPCVVQVHGGPESAYVDGWLTSYGTWGEVLAANGYVVFFPNYRGSTGRGVAYSKADHLDLGGKEFEDILDGLDYLAKEGYIDRERVGMGGFSYGGYFSALAATRYTEHFKAACIANWLSFTGTSDIPYENSMVHWNMSIWNNLDKAMQASPINYVAQSKTALLISHGDKDDRVPLGQGWEIYTALKMLGKTVEFDIYPREQHGFRERNHQLHYLRRVLRWFDKHVKGEATF